MRVAYQNHQIIGEDLSLDHLRIEILDRVKLHTEMISRLLTEPAHLPQDFAAFLEDVANAYLDIAEEVSASAMSDRSRPN